MVAAVEVKVAAVVGSAVSRVTVAASVNQEYFKYLPED